MKKSFLCMCIMLVLVFCVLDAEAFFGGVAWRRHYRRVRRERVLQPVSCSVACQKDIDGCKCNCSNCSCSSCSVK